MKASSSASATTATMMALNTKPAGPSRQILSKMDSIAQSQIGVSSVLPASLMGDGAGDVLPLGETEAQTAAVGLRGESADLIGAGKVFSACGEKDISGELRCFRSSQRKYHSHASGGAPLRAGPGKRAACTGGGQ